jgi:hypothetical protein
MAGLADARGWESEWPLGVRFTVDAPRTTQQRLSRGQKGGDAMSLMTRIRIAVVQWWIRSTQDGAPAWEDLEGLGRLLARPRPVRAPSVRRTSAPPSAVPVTGAAQRPAFPVATAASR